MQIQKLVFLLCLYLCSAPKPFPPSNSSSTISTVQI
ncbi:unnamed protein product [Arabidopsis halleri]